jgi:NADH dehydrogenase
LKNSKQIHAVTGALGYSGRYIAKRLLEQGYTVITLTNSVHRENPFGERIKVYPFNFNNSDKLKESLEGVSVLYNTYWVRFNHKLFTYADAVKNTLILFEAAKRAGVERIVHISITKPSTDLNLEYFQGKAVLEKALIESGISYAILRPAVLFGKEDILINNIAWALRRFPVFGVFGDGNYGIQPIHVDDLAKLAVEQATMRENKIINAIGPETFTYRELVGKIGKIIGKKRPIISVPPIIGYLVATLTGWIVGDIFVTWDEIKGLMAGTLAVDTPPIGETKLTSWAARHASTLGKRYTSELARRIDRQSEYQSN